MADIALVKKKHNGREFYDIDFNESGDFLTTDGLDTALLMSLEGERRASKSEVVFPEKQRGWIGNAFGDKTGYEIGNKKWLYIQSRLGLNLLNQLVDTIKKGFDWLVEDGICDKILVKGNILTSKDIKIDVELYKDGALIKVIESVLWKNTTIA